MQPSFSPIVGFNLSTVLFTLASTLLIIFMYRKFMHDKVAAMLEKRRELIESELDSAEQAKLSVQEKEREYSALLADSKSEAEKILSAANVRALEKEREILSEANQSAARILEKADENIELEKKRVVNEIKNQISELVIMTASAVAEKEISEDDNSALIDSFLVKI
ncbi:MAG: F0F1 ATP synthase subunit B [Oscillospiraceae bacterium]|jgi:F-type H+-transporting ATPase subunit b|nr:F0F1 ATP synthase subunit B [Oscillospiraceae bacterium]